MLRVSAASMPPPWLSTIVSSAPSAAIWLRFSALNASDVTMLSGYPRAAQISASETPVLPPVYSTTRCPGASRPDRSPASIMASAIRSFMLPVGFSLSILISTRAQFSGTARLSSSKGVLPMRCRMEGTIIIGSFHVSTNDVAAYIYETDSASRQEIAGRGCAGGRRHLRRDKRASRCAADHGVSGGADAPDWAEHRAVRPDDADCGG